MSRVPTIQFNVLVLPIPDEIDGVLATVKDSIDGKNDKLYVLAQDTDGNVTGMIGLMPPSDKMKSYTSGNAVEIINAYISPDSQRQGVGTFLLEQLFTHAKDNGITEIDVNSEPRYQESGWPFWNEHFGNPVTLQKDQYGPGRDAPIWHKHLT
ncbi:MAG: GNAT family N-acetyltransferase [Patescibacteria group bacterium]